ncbi:alcohol dehydrogenase small subunit [Gluconobacter thailandicus F149-1 = NBRC 100600]|uniref:Alcohol dehydrogenase small subunit n=1 Tax=Gluconobacter thailandicus NBRC 3257 TaxID=1381097 RepID=A0ABQ0IV93_GLUTH|nr:DUF2501 domain-containing protein [Gluconobacter thailandicus]KXV52067.1 hypothetical protein AD946_14090 [Gluconobacter thailandicus]GAC86559.1 hypothetical protein NBRC3255_0220 [Gluconobacter thailandicus NBRC 3255]GAD26120.1 hypothetical protein NBRC3257_1119 [Gluconobacter thailandicus NBRC 3257]GAN93102.1 alcohol dehydrogenase small subunit [Gluconobacter thailandicus F149-1 = NBRC 100600]GBR59874.1 hypothetical protein AA100600_1539 [Gluconobacter thailandicus F149-1 = NBRC 100600]
MVPFRLPALLSAGALATIAALSLGGCASETSAAQNPETQAAATAAATAAAQSTASQLTGGLTGALGLPNLSSTSTGNLAGVLNYCVTNNLTSGGAASGLLSTASQQPGLTGSSDYSAGQQGILQAISNQTSTSQQYSLSSLAEPLRRKVCSTVSSRLQGML